MPNFWVTKLLSPLVATNSTVPGLSLYKDTVATDAAGNIYTVCYIRNGGVYVAVIVKITKQGTYLWQKQFIYEPEIWAIKSYSLVLDSQNNIIIAGVAGYHFTGDEEGFVCKLDTNGTVLWTKKFTRAGQAQCDPYSLSVDGANNIYCTGNCYELSTNAQKIIFVFKLNSSGSLLWQRESTIADATFFRGFTVAVESSGNNICIGGAYAQTTASSVQRGYFAKYNSSGTLQWQKQITDANSTTSISIYGLAIDSSNNIYSLSYYGVGNANVLVTKYNSSGSNLWSARFANLTDPANLYVSPGGITVNSNQEVCFTSYGAKNAPGNYFVNYAKLNNSNASISLQRQFYYPTLVGDLYTEHRPAFGQSSIVINCLTVNYSYAFPYYWSTLINYPESTAPSGTYGFLSVDSGQLTSISSAEAYSNASLTDSPGGLVFSDLTFSTVYYECFVGDAQ